MRFTLLEKVTLERSLIYVLIIAVLITFVFIFYLFFAQFTRKVELQEPIGGEEWEIGQTYSISWKARGIDRVGIVLFKGTEPRWVAKNVYADLEKYDWKIYAGQEYGDDYWIAVFEYPWKKGNKIDYSEGAFAITYPELASCDNLSVDEGAPYIPSDLPNLRRVFITEETFTGSLGGLDGADRICQEEAERRNFEGNWIAFLGGDSDDDLAVKRLERTAKKTEGVYIQADPKAVLIRGATCHRLLGKDFSEFLENFSNLSVINEGKFEDEFLKDFKNVWLGRLNEKSKKNCTSIASAMPNPYLPTAEKYSHTTTCQNWTQESQMVEGYPVSAGEPQPAFATCYTPGGASTKAVALGGLATGTVGEGADEVFTPYEGKHCNEPQKLMCIEQ